jgi:hypothetical protein
VHASVSFEVCFSNTTPGGQPEPGCDPLACSGARENAAASSSEFLERRPSSLTAAPASLAQHV